MSYKPKEGEVCYLSFKSTPREFHEVRFMELSHTSGVVIVESLSTSIGSTTETQRMFCIEDVVFTPKDVVDGLLSRAIPMNNNLPHRNPDKGFAVEVEERIGELVTITRYKNFEDYLREKEKLSDCGTSYEVQNTIFKL